MKNFLLFAFLLFSIYAAAEESITVYKEGYDFFVRSKYSETEDLVIHTWRYANEKAYLIKRGAPLAACKKGKVIHVSSDDYPAVAPLGGFGTLSGNHGSFYTRCLTVPDHGLTAKDKGGTITEKKGTAYIILQIIDKDNLLIHPEGSSDTINPRFRFHSKEPLFYKGKALPFTKSVMRQLYPLNRITQWQLLADGTDPIPEKKEVKCRFADFIFVHDVLNPYYVVQSIKKNPQDKEVPQWNSTHSMFFLNTPELQKKYGTYARLPAIATYANKFRFQPRGACVNYKKITYHVPLSQANNLDVMLGWGGLTATQKRQFFYIPKVKPVTITDRKTKETRVIDLASGIFIPIRMEYSYYMSAKDALNIKDLPDRFIRICGDEKKYHYGVALGYSLFMGHTAKKKMPGERRRLYHLYKTHKMYPFSSTPRNIAAGKVENIVAYRQYFDPQREPDATSFYCHYQGDSLMVYLDFHKKLENKIIKLPGAAAGKKITILEKTPLLTLHTSDRVPASGITLSNNAGHGYLVLKLDKK